MKSKGVRFVRDPIKQVYGAVAVFEDLYGNDPYHYYAVLDQSHHP